ncbi:Hypothetical protein FKW44_024048 [Caligus rogercresseyi]|uniref:Uncharacterized protein n=1 Tax=Caligus rogercresseyi TaxID=217165 RepID=A0A7T8JVJ9_CALRO|nr:Hypothetical protein FKW44_024048 [Caligus rogercresseyi]
MVFSITDQGSSDSWIPKRISWMRRWVGGTISLRWIMFLCVSVRGPRLLWLERRSSRAAKESLINSPQVAGRFRVADRKVGLIEPFQSWESAFTQKAKLESAFT